MKIVETEQSLLCYTLCAISEVQETGGVQQTVLHLHNITTLHCQSVTVLQYCNITALQRYNFTVLQRYERTDV